MKLHKYNNYEEYKNFQYKGIVNHHSVEDNLNYEWVQKEDIEHIKHKIIKPYCELHNIKLTRGICHGAKLGKENQWFQEALGFPFIGTDLSIKSNPDMQLIQWDFHDYLDIWIGLFDVIYSNALDHSYDPILALKNWGKCLTSKGMVILEHTQFHEESNEIDPFGASYEEYLEIIQDCNFTVISKTKITSNHPKNFIAFTKEKETI